MFVAESKLLQPSFQSLYVCQNSALQPTWHVNVFWDILQSRFEGLAGVLVYQGAVAELNTELSSIHQKIVISCYGYYQMWRCWYFRLTSHWISTDVFILLCSSQPNNMLLKMILPTSADRYILYFTHWLLWRHIIWNVHWFTKRAPCCMSPFWLFEVSVNDHQPIPRMYWKLTRSETFSDTVSLSQQHNNIWKI